MDRSDNGYFIGPKGSSSHGVSPTSLQTALLEKVVDRLDILSSKLELVSQNQLYQVKDMDSLYRKLDLLDIRLETVHQYNKVINDRITLLESTNQDLRYMLEKMEKKEKEKEKEKASKHSSRLNSDYYKAHTLKSKSKSKPSLSNKPRIPPRTKSPPEMHDPYYGNPVFGISGEDPNFNDSAGNKSLDPPHGLVFDFVISDEHKFKNENAGMFENPMELLSKILSKKPTDKEKPNEEEEEEEEEEEDYSYDEETKVEDLGEIKTIDDLIKIGESVQEIKDDILKDLKDKKEKSKVTHVKRNEEIDQIRDKYTKYLGKEKKISSLHSVNSYTDYKAPFDYPKPPTRKPPQPPIKTSRTTKTKTNLEDRKHIPLYINEALLKHGVKKKYINRMVHGKPIKKMEYMDNPFKEKEEEIKVEGVRENGLYKLGDKYYPFDLDVVEKLVNPLKKLNKMIGMKSLKESILNQIIYYLQKFESKNKNMLHTVIQGPPGVGKTEVAKILCQVFVAMGAIKDEKIVTARRKDLVGEYVGHTAPKVEKIVKEAEGGVLFIDEAYGLGGGDDKKDTFSREAVNTLTELLSLKKNKFICIISGYAEELEKNLFSINPGMERRFPYRHHIDTYSSDEMRKIFMKMVSDRTWKISKEINDNSLRNFFDRNKDTFPYYGGDIENLFMHCRNAHSRRVYRLHPSFRKTFNMEDIETGYENYKKHRREDSKESKMKDYIYNTMYR